MSYDKNMFVSIAGSFVRNTIFFNFRVTHLSRFINFSVIAQNYKFALATQYMFYDKECQKNSLCFSKCCTSKSLLAFTNRILKRDTKNNPLSKFSYFGAITFAGIPIIVQFITYILQLKYGSRIANFSFSLTSIHITF